MGKQFVFYLQSGELVAPRFDDIDRRTPHDSEITILDHADIPGTKPTCLKTGSSRFGIVPVLQKYRGALYPDLAGYALLGNDIAGIVDKLNRNIRQGLTHVSGASLSAVGIRQRHPDFSHTVTF